MHKNGYSAKRCEYHFTFHILCSGFYLWLIEYLLKAIKVSIGSFPAHKLEKGSTIILQDLVHATYLHISDFKSTY